MTEIETIKEKLAKERVALEAMRLDLVAGFQAEIASIETTLNSVFLLVPETQEQEDGQSKMIVDGMKMLAHLKSKLDAII